MKNTEFDEHRFVGSQTANGESLANVRVDAPVVLPSTVRGSSGVSIVCHQSELPAFVETELNRLYGNLFSSLAHFRVYGGAENAHAYVVRKAGEISCLWLFRREGSRVRVLNEGIRIDEEEACRFADYIFDAYPSVDVIAFHAVELAIRTVPFPHQRFNCLEDIVLTMPKTSEQYRASLGKSTRSYIQRYLNKLIRTFPSFRHKVYDRQEADEHDIREIVRMNRARMAYKGKVSTIGEKEIQRIIRLVRECGLVSVITIDSRVCAGTINFNAGDNYFLEVIAHDPEYDEYRLGTLCCYLTICECIARGGNEYHFLWGQNEYKYRLLGVQRDLDDLVLYRSHVRMLRNGDLVLRNLFANGLRRGKVWLHDGLRNNRFPAQVLFALLRRLRSVTRVAS